MPAATFPFVVLFGLIAILARAVAVTTEGPWFSAEISLQMYSFTLLAAVVVAVGLSVLGAIRVSHLDSLLFSLSLRISSLRRAAGLIEGKPEEAAESPSSSFTRGSEGGVRVVDLGNPLTAQGMSPALEVSVLDFPELSMAVANGNYAELEKELVTRHERIEDARRRVWWSFAGPLVASLVLVTIAGTMLPGADGFATANFRLNTTFILFIGYGWWLLILWLVYAIVTLPTGAEKRKRFRPQMWEPVE